MNSETVIGLSKIEKALVIIIPPILGATLGWFLPDIVNLALDLPKIPKEGLLEFISSFDRYWVSIIATVIGIIAGVMFSQYAFTESLKLFISDQKVSLMFKGKEDVILRKDISTVYIENKHLIILGINGIELYRERHESKKAMIKEAFKSHGYQWAEEDPYKDQYQRWVTDHPDFPSHVNTLLSTRERAIEKDKCEEAKALRKDLAKLGVVIRDEDKRQYIRML